MCFLYNTENSTDPSKKSTSFKFCKRVGCKTLKSETILFIPRNEIWVHQCWCPIHDRISPFQTSFRYLREIILANFIKTTFQLLVTSFWRFRVDYVFFCYTLLTFSNLQIEIAKRHSMDWDLWSRVEHLWSFAMENH